MNYPNPCDSCENCTNPKGCLAWEMRFRTIWKQFNSYPIRQYKKSRKLKKFAYEHPDLIKKYLDEGPCKGCEFELLCDVPCSSYYLWWDARREWLKRRLGL